MRRPLTDDPVASSSPRIQTLPGRAPFGGSPTSRRYAVKIIRKENRRQEAQICASYAAPVDTIVYLRRARRGVKVACDRDPLTPNLGAGGSAGF
ncbi:jg3815 [Pararge aegeria aegeria]|uniref:Jg3815 protein n=1 Tax=Pararge aegeria aegeria TaxID=348720 RepID=A0A8S4RXZ2_9NEOP|nr:jg3815 [Pararge aegeria aegeria]